jgi:signal peptidase I
MRARASMTLVVAAASLLIAGRLALRRWAVVTVDGPSMEPTLRSGDRVLVHLRAVRVTVGDVVVVEGPGPGGIWWLSPAVAGEHDRRWLIKRVAAVEGDVTPATVAGAVPVGTRVPPGRILVLGDNLSASADSRILGFVPAERVFGLVVRTLRVPATRAAMFRSDFGFCVAGERWPTRAVGPSKGRHPVPPMTGLRRTCALTFRRDGARERCSGSIRTRPST